MPRKNPALWLAILALAALAVPAFAADTIPHNEAITATSPLPAGSCLYVDQGPGTDTKLCTGYPAAFGAAASNATFTLGSTTVTLGATTSTVAGLTLTAPTINAGALSGTFSGSHTLSGVITLSGLSIGTQTRCLGLDSGNTVVLSTGSCAPEFPITIGSTSIAAGSTTPTLAGLTLTAPVINAATLSGTFAGNHTVSGVVTMSGLAVGTQTRCIGLDVGNTMVLSTGSCVGFPITVGSTSIAAGSTTTTLAGLTVTAPTINAGTLSGTFAGAHTLSGVVTMSAVPVFSGLSNGTQTRCLGLDAGNNLVTVTGACGVSGGTGFPIVIGSTSIGSGSTTTTLAGLTLTAPTINAATLSGTLAGSPTLSGVPIFSGLSAGTQTKCLGLDATNNLVTAAGACAISGTGFPITIGSTSIAASSTTTTLAGLTLTAPTINAATLSGTLAGNHTVSGVVTMSGLSVGTQTRCLGLDSGNIMVLATGACAVGTPVTSVATTAPIAGGTITTTGTISITGPSNLTTFTTSAIPKGAGALAFAASSMLENGTLLSINYNAAAAPAALSDTRLQITGPDAAPVATEINAFNGAAISMVRRADGTNASKTAVQAADSIGSFAAFAYDGTAYPAITVPNTAFRSFASQNQTTGAHGAYAEVTTTANGTTTPIAVIRYEHNGGITVPPSVTGGNLGPGILNVAGLAINGVTVTAGGSGTPTFGGTTAGTANAQTMAASGYTLVDQNFVRVKIGAGLTNTGATTLNINGTGAVAVNKQNVGGLSALTCGELVAGREYELTYNSAGPAYVIMNGLGPDVTSGATSSTISCSEWVNRATFVITAAGQTKTLPAMSTLPNAGGITIQTVSVAATLTPNAADGINNSPINTPVQIASDATVMVTKAAASGVGAVNAPLGPRMPYILAWAEGLNLSSAPRYLGRIGAPMHIASLKCRVQIAAGSASTITVYSVPSGTDPATGGTRIDTNGCDANAASVNETDMGFITTNLTGGDTIWARFSGSGTSGNGGLTVLLQ